MNRGSSSSGSGSGSGSATLRLHGVIADFWQSTLYTDTSRDHSDTANTAVRRDERVRSCCRHTGTLF